MIVNAFQPMCALAIEDVATPPVSDDAEATLQPRADSAVAGRKAGEEEGSLKPLMPRESLLTMSQWLGINKSTETSALTLRFEA